MHKVKIGTIPSVFDNKFEVPYHSYPTRFSNINFTKRKLRLKKSRFRIFVRGPTIWKDFVDTEEKALGSALLFKTKVKSKLHTLRFRKKEGDRRGGCKIDPFLCQVLKIKTVWVMKEQNQSFKYE